MVRGYHSAESVLCCLAMLALTPLVAKAHAVVEPEILYLDPKDDPSNPLRYIASNALTAVAFALVIVIALIQTFYTIRYGGKWMLAMVIGAYTYAVGFGWRFALHYHPDSLGIYVAETMFIVLSPCAFIAANYVLLGRLARHMSCTSHVLLPVQRLTTIFVASDISTFLMQATGGSLSTSHNLNSAQMGTHLFLAGLALQLGSFALFSGIYVRFLYRVYFLERDTWERDKAQPWRRDWRTLAGALAISSIGILVRSGYRVAELSQGYHGHLASTEAFFYALDTLPLLVAIFVYVLFWPGWFIRDNRIEKTDSATDVESKGDIAK